MAAFTSIANGNWNDGPTTWGTGAGVYPGSAQINDTASIGHTVAMNVATLGFDMGLTTITSGGILNWDTENDKDFAGITVNSGGTLHFKHDADTKIITDGSITGNSGATIEIGTVANPIALGNTCEIQFDCASDKQYYLYAKTGSTIRIQGNPITYTYTTLASQANSGQKDLITSDTTGWQVGDELAIQGTDRQADPSTSIEVDTIANISGTTITMTSNLTHTHLAGAEIFNLTRNVRLTSVDDTKRGWGLPIYDAVDCDIDYLELKDQYYNFDLSNSSNTSIQYSSVHGKAKNGIVFEGGDFEAGTCELKYNCFVRTSPGITDYCLYAYSSSKNITDCSYNRIMGFYYGVYLNPTNNPQYRTFEFDNCVFCNSKNYLVYLNSGFDINFSNCTFAYGGNGIILNTALKGETTIDTCSFSKIFNWAIVNLYGGSFVTIKNSTIDDCGRGMYLVYAGGFKLENNTYKNSDYALYLTDSQISDVFDRDSDYQSTNTVGILISNCNGRVGLTNCKLDAPTQVQFDSYDYQAWVAAQDLGQVAGVHKIWRKAGNIESETTVFKAASPSLRFDPADQYEKLKWNLLSVPTESGTPITVTIWARKDASYNGSSEPLIRLSGAGITEVTDTLSVAADTWEQLSCTGTPTRDDSVTLSLETIGTAGYAYFDDIEVSGNEGLDTGDMGHWYRGAPVSTIMEQAAAPITLVSDMNIEADAVNYADGDTVTFTGDITLTLDCIGATVKLEIRKKSDDSLVETVFTKTANFTADTLKTVKVINDNTDPTFTIAEEIEYYAKLIITGGTPAIQTDKTDEKELADFVATEVLMLVSDMNIAADAVRYVDGDTVTFTGNITLTLDCTGATVKLEIRKKSDNSLVETVLDKTANFVADTLKTIKAINSDVDPTFTIPEEIEYIAKLIITGGTPPIDTDETDEKELANFVAKTVALSKPLTITVVEKEEIAVTVIE